MGLVRLKAQGSSFKVWGSDFRGKGEEFYGQMRSFLGGCVKGSDRKGCIRG